jgi:hypothetical protein
MLYGQVLNPIWAHAAAQDAQVRLACRVSQLKLPDVLGGLFKLLLGPEQPVSKS